MLTADYIKQCLDYDPDTGIFTWKRRSMAHFKRERSGRAWNTKYAGIRAGTVDGKRYLHLSLGGKFYRLHRLAFVFMTGEWPKGEVDHKDHDRQNNRWANLRDVTIVGNRRNQSLSSKSTCGVTGVYLNTRGKWAAQIKVNKKVHYLGGYGSKEQAAAVRKQADNRFGFHPNHGLPPVEPTHDSP